MISRGLLAATAAVAATGVGVALAALAAEPVEADTMPVEQAANSENQPAGVPFTIDAWLSEMTARPPQPQPGCPTSGGLTVLDAICTLDAR